MVAAKGLSPTIIQKKHLPSWCFIMLYHAVASPSFDQKHCDLLGNQDGQIQINNNAKPLWMACAATHRWHSKRPKNHQRSIRCSITFSWSLICMCIIPLFRPQAMQFWTCGMQKDWVSGTAINTKPETHQCFVVRFVRPWLGMQFQGLDPPPVPQIRGDSIGLRISRWIPRHVLPRTCISFCSELLTNDILKPLALGYQ